MFNSSRRLQFSIQSSFLMPGIVAIIDTSGQCDHSDALTAMVGAMDREPFLRTGTMREERLGAWLGWACHEGSFSDCLPIWNEERDVGLVFTGEDFATESEVEALRRKGHRFGRDDASYLVHSYEESGAGFLEKINGWFSGVLVDLRENRVIVFNDRYGFNRLYHHCEGDRWYFASEAKSLLRVLPKLRSFDGKSLGEVLSCGCALQNRSLFAGVSLVPGGAAWKFHRQQQPKLDVYFRKEQWEGQPRLTASEYQDRLLETFGRILPKYLRSNRPIAMSLTGGLDGRMIMAVAKPTPGSLPCYTFGSRYRECTDVVAGRRVARHCQQSHKVIVLDGQFVDNFPELAASTVYASDGSMDVTGAADLYVNRIARKIAPVRLTGNYGSEILRGNYAFSPRSLSEELFSPEMTRLMNEAATTYAIESDGHPLSFIAFKQVPWHHYSRLSVENTQLTLRAPYLDNDLVALVYQAPPEMAVSNVPAFRLIRDGDPVLARIPTDRGLVYPPRALLTKLTNSYQEFTFKAEYAYDYGMPQWLARIDHFVSPLHLERLFLGRHKFYHFRVWYRDELAAYLKDVLLDPRTLQRSYLRRNCLESMVMNHVRGTHNYTRELHKVLTTELTYRQFIDPS